MEGTGVRIAAERMARFRGSKVLEAHGNARIDMARMSGRVVEDVFSRGKHCSSHSLGSMCGSTS